MKIITILGTRPEIIKLSPIIPLFDKEFEHVLIHTGQHYSYNMDKIFFEDLALRDCDYTLNIGSGSHAMQTGQMMIEIEKVLLNEKPDIVIVQGDTNSTLAGAITASKLNINIGHVEAGCRSFDKKMPEEINRVLVDHCSDILFAPDKDAVGNLISEGIYEDKIHLVGNTSVDACLRIVEFFDSLILKELNLKRGNYILVTIHRQENTEYDKLKEIINAINSIANKIKIVFPLHLRTKKIIESHNLKLNENILITEPIGYKSFTELLANSKFVMTDSGGIQEESAILNVPCLILRENTEWKYLVNIGKNKLIGSDYTNITNSVNNLLDNEWKLDKMKDINAPIKKEVSKGIVSILKNVSNP